MPSILTHKRAFLAVYNCLATGQRKFVDKHRQILAMVNIATFADFPQMNNCLVFGNWELVEN